MTARESNTQEPQCTEGIHGTEEPEISANLPNLSASLPSSGLGPGVVQVCLAEETYNKQKLVAGADTDLVQEGVRGGAGGEVGNTDTL